MKWVFLLAFGSIGLSALIAGVVWGAKRYALFREGVRTTGEVVDNHVSHGQTKRDGRTVNTTSFYPVVEFTAADGKKRRFTGSTGSGSPSHETGARVDVIYSPSDPDKAQMAEFTQFWLGPLGTAIFGLLFFVAGLGAFFGIGSHDKHFGPEFGNKINMAMLYKSGKGIRLEARVREVRTEPGTPPRYTIVCEGGAPGGTPREFLSPALAFDPGSRILGEKVEVYADPSGGDKYYVHLQPLFGGGDNQGAHKAADEQSF